MTNETYTLSNIGEGIANELFDDGLQKILSNISDEETNQHKARKLVLEFSFEATEEPEEIDIHISSRLTLAPKRGRKTKAFISYDGGQRQLSPNNPNQLNLFSPKAAGDEA